MVRKFRDFLKDESATAAIEYIILAASIAVAIITAVKPANPSLACRACGRPMRFVTAIAKVDRHPELRTYECNRCKETVVEEWRPRESGRRAMPAIVDFGQQFVGVGRDDRESANPHT